MSVVVINCLKAKECEKTKNTYTFPGPVIVKQFSLVQNSEITPYIKFTWLKNDIAEIKKKIIIK